ncbi:MAG: succinate dehydrogenase, hydrophobic membrane anchor protein [Gammaproteobacteria bacterium]|nr:succinate dehydrogenase, hydrophobic membrane anchor protein [Gammaproteobacteria bacterium]
MNLVTPLNRVLGLGSAKGGVEHWWVQRLTAGALALLGLWLAFALAGLDDYSYAAVVEWIARPGTSVLLILTSLTLAYHSWLGIQVVIEDYVHGGAAKITLLTLSTFAHVAIGIVALFSILRISFGAVS